MKKLLLTLEYPPHEGGVSLYLKNLVGQFKPEDIHVVAPRTKNSFVFDQKQDYGVTRTKMTNTFIWPHWLPSYRAAREAIKKEGSQHLIISHVLPMGYVALLCGIPFTVIVHGLDIMLAKSKPHRAFLLGKILKKADLIIANSEFTRSQVLDTGISTDKVITAYPCPKPLPTKLNEEILASVRNKHNLHDKKVLLSVNRLVARKGNDRALEAIAMVRDDLPDIKYLIIGRGGYESELRKRIESLGLEEVVEILTDIEDDLLPYYYKVSDLFIMPSRIVNLVDYEGFGIVYLEAALFQMPSIAGMTGGAPEAVIDGATGLLVDPDNPVDIAVKIIQLLQDDTLREELGQRAYNRTVEKFNWKDQFSEVVKILS